MPDDQIEDSQDQQQGKRNKGNIGKDDHDPRRVEANHLDQGADQKNEVDDQETEDNDKDAYQSARINGKSRFGYHGGTLR